MAHATDSSHGPWRHPGRAGKSLSSTLWAWQAVMARTNDAGSPQAALRSVTVLPPPQQQQHRSCWPVYELQLAGRPVGRGQASEQRPHLVVLFQATRMAYVGHDAHQATRTHHLGSRQQPNTNGQGKGGRAAAVDGDMMLVLLQALAAATAIGAPE